MSVPATTIIYSLSLHDALPISGTISRKNDHLFHYSSSCQCKEDILWNRHIWIQVYPLITDRKSTRLNSSHMSISYAVFCLKKKTLNMSPTLQCSHAYTRLSGSD